MEASSAAQRSQMTSSERRAEPQAAQSGGATSEAICSSARIRSRSRPSRGEWRSNAPFVG
jgi:hypothetical protein